MIMALDPWLPIGHLLPDGAKARRALFEGVNWQVLETEGGGRALLADDALANRWIAAGLVHESAMQQVRFGRRSLRGMSCGPSHDLGPISECRAPDTRAEAMAFALALKATRGIDSESPLQDALYVEKLSRLLPTYSISSRTEDDVVFGYWLSGGVPLSVTAFRRLHQTVGWLGPRHLAEIVAAAGYPSPQIDATEPNGLSSQRRTPELVSKQSSPDAAQISQFELPGRPDLAAFVNEHVIDILKNRARYKALGVDFPGAIVLYGPPGCGKTFAVEKLVEYLQWPSFQIDASSVASPYIHQTSKKVAEVFADAISSSPSVLVIDEMEAFLADREMGSGHHRVEEVAEFLRRIPEAGKNDVLVVAMTNRIDMIDPAILRRGRFDHVIKVDYASAQEIEGLLESLFSTLPIDRSVDASKLARELAGRPLSDVTFVVREGARLAARAGKDRLDEVSLNSALGSTAPRTKEGGEQRRIGFV
jgi:hypothetical protein